MNDLKIFESPEFGYVRTVIQDGIPWFVGKDVADNLGYQNGSRDIERHVDEDDRSYLPIHDGTQRRNVIVINESGLYSLILSSKLESAKRFKYWVTSEVLPSIHMNGGYITNQENLSSEQILANAVLLAQNVIAQKDKQIEEMKPKADFFDTVANSKNATDMQVVAKVINFPGIGRNKLFEILRQKGILDRSNIPYQEYVDCGYFRVIEQKYTKNGEVHINYKTLVYQKGIDYIIKLLNAA